MNIIFWIVMIGFGFISYFVNDEEDGGNGVGATVSFLATLVVMWLVNRSVTLGTILQTIFCWKFLGLLLIYLFIGVVWSFVKWYFFLVDKKETFTSTRACIPKAKDYKGKIIMWMTYWFFSMWWTLLNHPIKKFFNWIYGKLENQYQKIVDKVFEEKK